MCRRAGWLEVDAGLDGHVSDPISSRSNIWIVVAIQNLRLITRLGAQRWPETAFL